MGLAALLILAVQVASDWNAVQALEAGSAVEIVRASGEAVEGRFRFATDDAIDVEVNGHPTALSRTSIWRIVVVGDRQTGLQARRGFLIGAVVGTLQTIFFVKAKANRGSWLVFLAGTEGAFGAAVGAIRGATTRQRILVYESAGTGRSVHSGESTKPRSR